MTTKQLIDLLEAADPDSSADVALVITADLDLDQASRWNVGDVTRFGNLIEVFPGVPRW